MPETRFGRIMLKVGGESIQGEKDYGIDHSAAIEVANQIKQIHQLGTQIAIVIGGGNIFRGVAGSKSGIDRATADYMGMLGTVINGLALQDAIEKVGVPTRLQSALLMPAVAESFIRRRAIRHMEKGRVVILAAGTGVPYVTTDTGASLHALELDCDVLMKATKVDGVYERDPKKDPGAKRYKTLNFKDAISLDEIQIMDTSALAMCQENELSLMVFELFKPGNLVKAITGQDVGTYLSSSVETQLA
ncbi:MAG TPA: UMP kinase [Candidatus Woesebacteria bacterium]|mgnify:CR=1 FL=1|nr:UMP kinase [Candidatus Woesebacteria bacterium]